MAATCRCPICGKKNAGKSRNGKFHREYEMSRDENGSGHYGFDRDRERRLERRRAKQKLFNKYAGVCHNRQNIQKYWMDNWDDNEDWEAV